MISVIIPTYNRAKFIIQTLNSIDDQNFSGIEVIIVDDGSTDSTREIVENFEYSKSIDNIHYIKIEHSGTPRAWNKGVSCSSRNPVLLMGDDVYLEEDCIDNLMNSWNSLDSKNIGAIAPRLVYLYNLKESEEIKEGTSYMNINPLTGNVRGSSNYNIDKIINVETTHGFSLINKTAFESVNGFDEKSFTGNFYREETDLYLRIREKGFKIYYNPKARIRVQKGKILGGQWTNVGSNHLLNEYFIFKNHYVFLSKHFGKKKYYMIVFFFFERIFEWINIIISR